MDLGWYNKPFTVYCIKTTHTTLSKQVIIYEVERRYTDFEELHRILENSDELKSIVKPALPAKQKKNLNK